MFVVLFDCFRQFFSDDILQLFGGRCGFLVDYHVGLFSGGSGGELFVEFLECCRSGIGFGLFLVLFNGGGEYMVGQMNEGIKMVDCWLGC